MDKSLNVLQTLILLELIFFPLAAACYYASFQVLLPGARKRWEDLIKKLNCDGALQAGDLQEYKWHLANRKVFTFANYVGLVAGIILALIGLINIGSP